MNWILQHQIISFVGGFALLNAAVQAMDTPTEKDGRGYRYIYRFGHLLCFNFQYALKAQFPAFVPAVKEQQ